MRIAKNVTIAVVLFLAGCQAKTATPVSLDGRQRVEGDATAIQAIRTVGPRISVNVGNGGGMVRDVKISIMTGDTAPAVRSSTTASPQTAAAQEPISQ